MHYHNNDVKANMEAKVEEMKTVDMSALTETLLTFPVVERGSLTPEVVTTELRQSSQSILGYVVRWIDQGVGCSKVPDLTDTGLMEDRATLRISCTVLQNWLLHGVITKEEVVATMKEMAVIVDRQNSGDALYKPLAPSYSGVAWRGALALCFEPENMKNGLTELVLHKYRRMAKQEQKEEQKEESEAAGRGSN